MSKSGRWSKSSSCSFLNDLQEPRQPAGHPHLCVEQGRRAWMALGSLRERLCHWPAHFNYLTTYLFCEKSTIILILKYDFTEGVSL